MVAMNSIPQQEVAKVMAKVNMRAIPTTSFRVVAKILLQQHLLAAQLFLCLNYSSFYILN
jgi:hypothetical protein